MNEAPTTNPSLRSWVRAVAEHTRPDRVHWWSGTRAERAEVAAVVVRTGDLIPLDPAVHPRSFLHRTDVEDASASESTSFVATHKRAEAGPTNGWMSRDDAHSLVWPLFADAMQGRTMYVVPYRVWPGGRENMRVLKWIAERVEGTATAQSTPLGFTPELDSLDLGGLDLTPDGLLQLLSGNHGAQLRQAERARAFLAHTLPPALLMEHRSLVRHLQQSLH